VFIVRGAEIVINEWRDPVRLILVGDLHLGHAATDEKMIAATCAQLEEPRTYWVNLGDTIDAINRADPRFDPRSCAEWIGVRDLADIAGAQIARYRHYFGRLGGTCLASVIGNHESAIQKHSERDVYGALNQAIGLPEPRALGLSGFLRLRFRRVLSSGKHQDTWTQTLYLHHGFGGGRLMGAKAIKLERLPASYRADIYAIGHTHSKLAFSKTITSLPSRGTRIEERAVWMINTGAYLGLAAYAEAKGYSPQARGPVMLTFHPSERRVEVTL